MCSELRSVASMGLGGGLRVVSGPRGEALSASHPAEPAVEPISIVVPTFNEAANVPVLFERVKAALDAEGRPFEFIVVDDNSPDGTAQATQALGPPARAILRTEERGLATAVIRGFQEAQHDICVCMDADLSHPPEVVHQLAREVELGARFSLGSRYIDGGRTQDWSALRALNSWGATVLARPLTRVKDPMSGFFCVRRSDVPFELLNPVGYKIALEILVKAGIRDPKEVPITFTDRLHGESKMGLKEQYRYLHHLVRLYAHAHPTWTQLGGFSIVGSIGLVVDTVTMVGAVELLDLPFEIARVLGFFVAVSSNFFLNDRFTFAADARGLPYTKPLRSRYLTFVATGLFAMVVNWVVSVGLYRSFPFFRVYYYLAGAAGALAGMAFNFAGSKLVVFRR